FGNGVAVLLIMVFLAGCTTGYRAGMHPPLKLKRELDSLKPNSLSQKAARYTIKKGDTIWRIAHNHGVLPDTIIKANKIKDVENIKPGQLLIIPRGVVVKKDVSERKVPAYTHTKKLNEQFKWPILQAP
ncbi:MAG: LysM peptidoglycan-binding domain-containing protein, partial [bacterium]|nr:LysM peptidoglycan-binding domain-containing protein [bacterium]